VNVRSLRDGEQTALLDLAGLWPSPDDFPMRDVFARYVEQDPRFDPRDVWVAETGGVFLSCVQIFPRKLVRHGKSVPIGGIGTVFTHPEHRAGGLAGSVMRAAMDDIQARAMELGLLFAGPVAFYEKLGWQSWKIQRPLLRHPGAGDPGALAAAEAFEPARDLAEVQEIHASYSRLRDGFCARDSRDWWISLRNSGNPGEEFLVAREGGRVVAYARAVCLSRFLVIMEWGCSQGEADRLAALFAALLTPRDADPLAPGSRPSPEFRSVASAPPILDEILEAALGSRGIDVARTEDPSSMFWVPNPVAFAHRFGEPYRTRDTGDLDPPGDRERRLLARVLPPPRFTFWPADRF
jgi:GNAT superfamily N-acetyltransferase